MSFLSSIGHALTGAAGGLLGTGGNPIGALVGGVVGAFGSHNAGKDIQSGANKGSALDQYRYDQMRGQFSPWTGSGGYAQGALNSALGIGPNSGAPGYGALMKPYGQNVPAPFQYSGQGPPGAFNPTAYKPFSLQDFYNTSPAYQFQKSQGMQGVLNNAAGGAGALSGAAQKDLMQFNQGLANTAWDNAFQQNMAGQQQRYAQQLGQYQGQLAGYNSQFGNQLAGYGQNLAQQEQGFGQYQTQMGNIYQRLLGVSGMGEQATGQLAGIGAGLTTDQAQGYTNAGVGQAYGRNGITSGMQQVAMGLPWGQIGDWMSGLGGGGGGREVDMMEMPSGAWG
jgi:hypothetical protein